MHDRLGRFRAACDEPWSLVLRLDDIRWLTGFTGGTAQLLVGQGGSEAWILVDGRYVERAASEIDKAGTSVTVVPVMNGATFVEEIARIVGGSPVGVDEDHLTAGHLRALEKSLRVRIAPTPMDQLRRVKDHDEIAAMAKAASIADRALQGVVADGICGLSEKQVRNRLDHAMRELGADTTGFDTIVATGSNGARPHHEPTDAVVADGDAVVIDMGAEVDGYRSDMTRTIMVGRWSAELQRMYDIVIEAQAAGVAAVRAGAHGRDVDAAVRAVFAREGVEHEYVHGTGHGVGLYIHEQPILSPRCEAILGVDEVVTVEPGLYRKGVGGVRIEDQVVVTGTGCRILTLSPKELSCPRSPRTI